MNTKTLKTVMIADKQSWEGGRRHGGQGQGVTSLPTVHQRPTLPSKKGRPRRAQRPGQRGKAQEHGGWGHKHPLRSPGAGQKGDYKSQETTKLNTKVGTTGKGRGVGRKERCGPGRCPSGPRPRRALRPCSRCSLGSGVASPGRCRRGARSPHSPSHSGGSSYSL